jgi:hypothetical protein
MRMNIIAISNAHPKCSDGIAANWLAKPLYGLPAPYDAGPITRAVSTKPRCGNMRGGASGSRRCTDMPAVVITIITLRNRRYIEG